MWHVDKQADNNMISIFYYYFGLWFWYNIFGVGPVVDPPSHNEHYLGWVLFIFVKVTQHKWGIILLKYPKFLALEVQHSSLK